MMNRRLNDADDEAPPPLPPPRKLRPVLIFDALDIALTFCDLRTLGRAMRVCSHWYARCHVPGLWESFALGKAGTTASLSKATRIGGRRVVSVRAAVKLSDCDVETLKGFAKKATAAEKNQRPSHAISEMTSSDSSGPPQQRECATRVESSQAAFSSAIDGHGASTSARDTVDCGPRRAAPWSVPLKTIAQEIDDAARAFFREAHRPASLPPAASFQDHHHHRSAASAASTTQLEWLEREHTILQRRSARVSVCSTELMATAASQHDRLNSVMDMCRDQERELAELTAAIDTWSQVAAEEEQRRASERQLHDSCTRARRSLSAFESAVVTSLLHAFWSVDPANSRTVSSAGGKSNASPPLLTTFVQLETLIISGCHSGNALTSSLGVQWTRFKRLFPVDDAYFDLKDAVLDEQCCDYLVTPSARSDLSSAPLPTQRWDRVNKVLAMQKKVRQSAVPTMGTTNRQQRLNEIAAADLFRLIEV